MVWKATLTTVVMALAGTCASADNFSWANAVSGNWSDHMNWNGPALQSPNSILDSAFLGGGNYDVSLDQNVSLGFLSVSGGAGVRNNSHSLFIDGSVSVVGIGSSISINNSPSPRDFDADTVSLNQSLFVISGGVAQIDASMTLSNGSAILGSGVVEMNGSENLVINEGLIWGAGFDGDDVLRIQRSASSSARLDWTSPDSGVTVWDGKTVSIELPYSGELGGDIAIQTTDTSSIFESTDPFVVSAGAEISLHSTSPQNNPSILRASGVDAFGHLSVSGHGTVDANLLALRGTGTFSGNARFNHIGSVLFLDSFAADATGDGVMVASSNFESTLNVVGGVSTFDLGNGSVFDLDGGGNRSVNVSDDSALVLAVENIDNGNSFFDGSMNIAGGLLIEEIGTGTHWTNRGEISLDQGVISGRQFVNNGIMQGRGQIESFTVNNGEIIADGGTLFLNRVDLDGSSVPESGVVRAETGDISLVGNSANADQFFSGELYVGDGVGIREVFEMNTVFSPRTDNGSTGFVSLNSGRMRAQRVEFNGELVASGSSRVSASGSNDIDRIVFGSGSVNTIAGTLEVDGRTWTTPNASFQGEGEIHAVSTVKGTFLQDGSDLGDVSLRSVGEVFLIDQLGDGRVEMSGLTLGSGASLVTTIEGFGGPGLSDRFIVLDEALVDGTLKLDLRPGFADPTPGQTYTILEAGLVSGTFSEVDVSGVSDQFRAVVSYHPDRIDVFVTCLADINADGMVNGLDFGAWLGAFNAQQHVADQNGDGIVNGLDFGAWLSNFNSGCGA